MLILYSGKVLFPTGKQVNRCARAVAIARDRHRTQTLRAAGAWSNTMCGIP
jgi:hypothetical protein